MGLAIFLDGGICNLWTGFQRSQRYRFFYSSMNLFCTPVALCGKGKYIISIRFCFYMEICSWERCPRMALSDHHQHSDSPLFSHLLCGCGQNQDSVHITNKIISYSICRAQFSQCSCPDPIRGHSSACVKNSVWGWDYLFTLLKALPYKDVCLHHIGGIYQWYVGTFMIWIYLSPWLATLYFGGSLSAPEYTYMMSRIKRS